MNADDFAALNDGMEMMIEAVTGFKEKAVAAGFSVKIAEAMALEYLKLIVGSNTK